MKSASFTGIRFRAQLKGFTLKALWLVCCCFSCAEFLDIDKPKNQVVGETAYEDNATATLAVIGIYTEMSAWAITNPWVSTSVLAGFSADELNTYKANEFVTNSLLPATAEVKSALWEPYYKYVYYANALLEGISKSSGVTRNLKMRLEGEAKFIRAFSFFYLTNLFGDVPLITGTDYRVNATFARTPQDEVYRLITKDLKEAQALLPADYILDDGQRVRATQWAATALLARVYLYTGAWAEAQAAATAVINNTALYELEKNDLAKLFLANNREAIWQLMPTEDYFTITYPFTSYTSSILLHDEMVNAFEPTDKRKDQWTGSVTVDGTTYYFPKKYRADQNSLPEEREYFMVLRLAEQYLIRAEARAMQDDLSGALADVNVIRERAGLPLIADAGPLLNRQDVLDAIAQERRIELMAEWGHRWLDLKRTNRADQVLFPIKKPEWQQTDVLYPIPQSEINNNPNLNPQNEGY